MVPLLYLTQPQPWQLILQLRGSNFPLGPLGKLPFVNSVRGILSCLYMPFCDFQILKKRQELLALSVVLSYH